MKKNNKWKNLKGILNLQILKIYVIIKNVLIVATAVCSLLLLKYKPVYKVTYLGEEAGYVKSKSNFEKMIRESILSVNENNIAYITLDSLPDYELKFVDKDTKTDEEEIFNKIKENSETTYAMYAVTLNGENKSFVSTLEEAEEVVSEIKKENENVQDLDLGIEQIYTNNLDELKTVEVADATSSISGDVQEIIKENERQKAIQLAKEAEKVIEGVLFTVKPVVGVITSRFGSFESIRSSAHQGIDIGSPNGTPIKAAADGTVTFAGYTTGGYGNLVVISHGNGIETYYGHASQIYVSKGQKVSAGDVIAAVGSTGRSTGNHLHFEIRKNGNQLNPEKYVYK